MREGAGKPCAPRCWKMPDLKSLIAELEKAKEGSLELGEAVSLATGWKHVDSPFGPVLHLEECSGREKYCNCVRRNPTLSLDGALTLVPEQDGSNLAGFLAATFSQQRIGGIPDKKLAIAVCIKVLRARDKA